MVVIVLLALPFVYARQGFHTQGVFLLFGVVFGVIFQRSRFCLVRAFREPFMTGDAEHTRAAALALGVSTLGFAILKFVDLKDKGDWVFPGAGIGALAGGTHLRHRDDAGGRLRGRLDLARGRGAGEALGRRSSGSRSAPRSRGWPSCRLARSASWAGPCSCRRSLGWGGAIVLTLAVAVAWALAATWNEDARVVSAPRVART